MPLKLQLDCPDDLWKEVLKYKINNDCKTLNDTVILLIKRGVYG